MPHAHDLTAEMRACIDNCQECHAVCTETMQHCLGLGGKHAEPAHIRLMADCAQICATSADFMLRGSPLHTRTCELCAEICKACAKDCERIAQNDRMMQHCVDVCRRCSQSCEQMAGVRTTAAS